MSKLKRVVLKESEWGPEYLVHPRQKTMCCLGFACASLGVPGASMVDEVMPQDVGIERFSGKVDKATFRLAEKAWWALPRKKYFHDKGPSYEASPLDTNMSYADILSQLNDDWHSRRYRLDGEQYARAQEKVIAAIRHGFKRCGLTLVYRGDL